MVALDLSAVFLVVALDLSAALLVVALDLSAVFLVGLIDGVAAQTFPGKQIHADPEDCPTIVEFLPLKQKEHAIKTEPRKQNEQHQNKQPPKQSFTVIKNNKIYSTIIKGGILNHSQMPSKLGEGVVVS